MNLHKYKLSVPRRSPVTHRHSSLQKAVPTPPATETPFNPTSQDPLIAKGWQREQYIGMSILLITLIAAVGFFSRRLEYALIFAFALSLVLIVFLLTV